jgi:hypothetical protein
MPSKIPHASKPPLTQRSSAQRSAVQRPGAKRSLRAYHGREEVRAQPAPPRLRLTIERPAQETGRWSRCRPANGRHPNYGRRPTTEPTLDWITLDESPALEPLCLTIVPFSGEREGAPTGQPTRPFVCNGRLDGTRAYFVAIAQPRFVSRTISPKESTFATQALIDAPCSR